MAKKQTHIVPPTITVHAQVGSTATPFINYWLTNITGTSTNWTINRDRTAWHSGTTVPSWQIDETAILEPRAVFEVQQVDIWTNLSRMAVGVYGQERRGSPGDWAPMERIIPVENQTVMDRLCALLRTHREAVILHNLWDELIMEANL